MSNRRRLPRPRRAAGVASGHLDCGCTHYAVLDVTCPACGHVMATPPIPSTGAVGDLRECGASCFRCGAEFEALAVISEVIA